MKKLIVLLIILFPLVAKAEGPIILINEIAWMGTTTSANDEWIELLNNTDKSVSLDGWVLKSTDEKLKIDIKGIIPAKGFYLLERTDDTTTPNITANIIYTGALNNNGVDLQLLDSLGNIIDEANFSAGWSTGDNTTKQTAERTSTGWQTSENPGGTPQGSLPLVIDSVETVLTETVIYPHGIIFNEVMPSPEGSDELNEWVEIHNKNDFIVDLSGWKIYDTQGKITTYIIPRGTNIKAEDYLIFKRPETGIILNNDSDGLTISNPNNKIEDNISYEKAPANQSYSRTSSGWAWSKNPTPGDKNIITSDITTSENPNINNNLATLLTTPLPKDHNFDIIILIAGVLTAISTTIFYILRKKLNKIKT